MPSTTRTTVRVVAGTAPNILDRGYRFQVRRIYAISYAAQVVYLKPRRYRPAENLPRPAVRLMQIKLPVPKLRLLAELRTGTRPQPVAEKINDHFV